MTIVGFNFNKIIVERNKILQGKVSINNNIVIKEVESKDLALGNQKQAGLRVGFEYGVKYTNDTKEDLAHIDLAGDVLILEQDDKVKQVLEDWKKNKNLDKDTTLQVLNTALAKCNIQSMILSRDINLPSPIPLPKVDTGEKPPV